MIKTCLFDLDGTLLDTLDTIKYYINDTASRMGLPMISREQARIFVGKGASNLVDRVFESYGIDIAIPKNRATRDEFFRDYVDTYDASPFYLTHPYDGIPELVGALRAKGIRLAVISNKPDPTVKQLIVDNFGDAFDIVEGAMVGVPLKPDPRAPLSICARLGVSPEETAYIGDTGTDMKTGKAYGAALNIGVSWGFRDVPELAANGATHIVNTPAEILALLENANG